MRKTWTTAIAIFLMVLLVAGYIAVGYFAWNAGLGASIEMIVGIIFSLVFAPVLHELGHVAFAKANGMKCMLVKCFCLQYQRLGKRRIRLVSPFAADQTQVLPTYGGNMKRRLKAYTLGGLILQGIVTAAVLAAAIVLACLRIEKYLLWGMLPYMAYLFILNVLPLEYPSGKTDVLVCKGINKNEPAEQTMLTAMEIQGRLYAGESFAQIDESLYFQVPQLAEDEPLFAVMLDLQYRYFLENGELSKAADKLNRLAGVQVYLSDEEVEKIAAELTYMHSLSGDFERASECGKLCEAFLRGDTLVAKRALAAYCIAFGEKEKAQVLIEQARALLEKERNVGLKKSEEILISRME